MRKLATIYCFVLASCCGFDCNADAADCPELARAEADVMIAQSVQWACLDPDECRVADAYIAAALDRLASARIVCGDVGDASPFEPSP